MKLEIVAAVIRRGNSRCAWCDCKLDTGLTCDRGIVCKLDRSESDSSMVASCVACNSQYAMYAHSIGGYTTAKAVQTLSRETVTESSPFVDYLIGATDDVAAFDTALARVEAQRHAPLGLQKGRAA